MRLRATRVNGGEWLLVVSSVLLLIDLFGLSWFGYPARFHAVAAMLGQSSSADGWNSFTVLGPFGLLLCLAGLSIAGFAATRLSPALPVVTTTLLLPVSFVFAVLVAFRVLLDPPSVHLVQAGSGNVIETRAGAYVGLVLSIAIFVGTYLAMRRDSVSRVDSPPSVERIEL